MIEWLALLVICGVFAAQLWRKGRSSGRADARREMQEKDHANARDIRRRVADAQRRLRPPDDDRGFRD